MTNFKEQIETSETVKNFEGDKDFQSSNLVVRPGYSNSEGRGFVTLHAEFSGTSARVASVTTEGRDEHLKALEDATDFVSDWNEDASASWKSLSAKSTASEPEEPKEVKRTSAKSTPKAEAEKADVDTK
jgi:hypothetical protein